MVVVLDTLNEGQQLVVCRPLAGETFLEPGLKQTDDILHHILSILDLHLRPLSLLESEYCRIFSWLYFLAVSLIIGDESMFKFGKVGIGGAGDGVDDPDHPVFECYLCDLEELPLLLNS